jgi:hypothetical protein
VKPHLVVKPLAEVPLVAVHQAVVHLVEVPLVEAHLVMKPPVEVPLAVELPVEVLQVEPQVKQHLKLQVARVLCSPKCFKRWNVSKRSWAAISNKLASPVRIHYLDWNKFSIPLLLGSLHTV